MVNHDPGGQEGTLTGPMLIKELILHRNRKDIIWENRIE